MLIYEEAAKLDEARWDDWLALYSENATYWVPSWIDYSTPTSDPATQLSLIYYASRRRLEERVWRLRSGQSPASVPLPRTAHMVTNIRVVRGDLHTVESNFAVHVFNPKRKEVTINFGRYSHQFESQSGEWKISSKKILLMNDYLPASIDINTI